MGSLPGWKQYRISNNSRRKNGEPGTREEKDREREEIQQGLLQLPLRGHEQLGICVFRYNILRYDRARIEYYGVLASSQGLFPAQRGRGYKTERYQKKT